MYRPVTNLGRYARVSGKECGLADSATNSDAPLTPKSRDRATTPKEKVWRKAALHPPTSTACQSTLRFHCIIYPDFSHDLFKMSWRNQGITGSNNIPLGARRRFGGESNGDSQNGSSVNSPAYGDSGKRGRSPARGASDGFCASTYSNNPSAEPAIDGVKRRKKRNRWGEADDNKAAGLMGLPTLIQANMTAEQLEAYILNLRIEEISQKLRINDVVPAEGDR